MSHVLRLSLALALAALAALLALSCGGPKPPVMPGWGGDAAPEAAPAVTFAGPDPIETGIAQLAARSAPDMQPEGAFVRQSIAAGQHVRVDVALKGGECYAILALGQQGFVGDLDVTLFYKDAQSGQLAPAMQDLQNDNTALLGIAPATLCPSKASDIVLDLSAKQGAGAVGVRLYSKPNAAVVPPNVVGSGDSSEELLKKNAATLAKGMEPEGAPMKYVVKEGETVPMMVTLAGGRCYSIVAVSPKDGVRDIAMRLLMPPFFTMEVARDKRQDNVAVIGSPTPQCPITLFPIPYRVDITAQKGGGPVAVQLFSKAK